MSSLHSCQTLKPNLIINRLHILFTTISISFLFHYRLTNIHNSPIPHFLLFISEFSLTCNWILRRPARWRPVKRFVYPNNLPKDLPPVDVFICTADPVKEPSLGVMNTVISAMSLDYPNDKLAVYLSDDAGSYVTLHAVRLAWEFAKVWVPFCRKFDVQIRNPVGYFSTNIRRIGDEEIEIEKRYVELTKALEKNSVNAADSVSRDHPPTIEVMNEDGMPYLVYVAREKRPSQPHHFKGGALNALLKVSAIISNAPYFLVLDCDHYCNDPTSARQAMCFYLDPEISQKLAWVQFPQKFRDTTEHDIYGGQLHAVWREGIGWDGLKGPSIYGCNFYMSRQAIYGMEKIQKDVDLSHLKKYFGSSNEFIKSIFKDYKLNMSRGGTVSDALQKEIQVLASSSYDIDTEWGNKVGYAYFTVVEDSITSLDLHCKGWISVFIDPERPCFLGACTTNMNDMLVQQTRWAFGLTQIALSKYCPLFYGPLHMSILQRMCYVAHTFETILNTVAFYGLGIIPQISLLRGIPLYPKVLDPYFIAFLFIFISSLMKHVQEVFSYGDSLMTSLYELRVWMMKSTSCYLYATINAVLDFFGLHEANFSLTSKVVDEEQVKHYEKGIYDFHVAPLLIIPCCSMYILNLASFIMGIAMIVLGHKGSEMFIQVSLPFFVIIVNYHILDAMFLRKDTGRISPTVTLLSLAISGVVLSLGSLVLI